MFPSGRKNKTADTLRGKRPFIAERLVQAATACGEGGSLLREEPIETIAGRRIDDE